MAKHRHRHGGLDDEKKLNKYQMAEMDDVLVRAAGGR